MQRLSGMDAAFLYTETRTAHMHVLGTLVLDPSTISGGYRFETLRDGFLARVLAMDVFRQRLVDVPFGLDHPRWVDDPELDPKGQVRRVVVDAPGGEVEFAAEVARIAGQPLDRERPLWEVWILEGLEQARVGIVFKIHHCMLDGASGAAMMGQLFDLSSDDAADSLPQLAAASPLPGNFELIANGLAEASKRPAALARNIFDTATEALPALLRATAVEEEEVAATMPFTTPRTSLSAALSSERSIAFAHADLAKAKRIKEEFGVTVNDVVLACCTRSLRNWLVERDELPETPLVASVPVNIRDEGDTELGNHVSVMFMALPVHLDDPVEQLLFIHDDSSRAKKMHADAGPSMITRWADVAPPYLMSAGARLYSELHLADHHQPIHSLVISNVPGPPCELYAAGARVEALYPLGPVMEGAALNMTVLSYRGSIDLGVVACPRTVDQVEDIASGFADAFDDLCDLADGAGLARCRRKARQRSAVLREASAARATAA